MEIPSASQTEKAILGEGYNTREESFAGECVMGETVYAGVPEALIQFERSMSETELAESLGFQVGVKARYGLVSGSMSAQFASDSSANDFSDVTVYSAQYKFKNAKLKYTGLTPVGQQAKGSSSESNQVWENWESACGHEYISEITLGASLLISIKVEFATKAEKDSFNASFKIKAPIGSVKATLDMASSKFGSRGFITIRAYQMGGDVSKLSQALSSKVNVNGQNVSALVNCSMDNPGACLAVLDRAIDYATHEFPQQIKPEYKPGDPAGPAELLYITRPWKELALFPPPALIAEGVKVARQDLSFQFEKNRKYRNRVRALQTGQLLLSDRQLTRIEQIDEEVSDNLRLINEAANVCYTHMDKCVAKVDEVKEKLKSFSEEDFEILPETFAQWYSARNVPGSDKSVQTTINQIENAAISKMVNPGSITDQKERGKAIEGVLPKVTFLSLSRDTDLKFLKFLPNLTELRLGNGNHSDLTPLSALSPLTKLHLTNNQVKDLTPLKSLMNLNYLDIQGNPIENIKSLASSPLANLFITADEISVVEGTKEQWRGTWVRRGQSNTFDVTWHSTTTGAEYSSRDVIELRVIDGQNVTFYCRSQNKNYHGVLSSNRQEVISGTANYSAGYVWTAKAKTN